MIRLCHLLTATLLLCIASANAQEVTFSTPGGFYDNPFELTLSCWSYDKVIHFTTNGNTPTASDPVYTHPLSLDKSLESRSNIYTIPTSPEDLWYQPKTVQRCIVIRAAAFDTDGQRVSPVVTNSYFIKALGCNTHGLPIMSLCADSLDLFDYNRGILVPALTTDRPGLLAIAILVAVIAALALFRSLTAYAERSGRSVNAWLPSLAVLVLLPALTVGLSGAQLGVSLPQLKGFNFAGGWVLVPELSALVIAMAIYNAAFIGELVRASIESVNKGQREAAAAIGFGWWQTLRFIVIPQATRVLLPPLSNQYLNILKGSSLAVAIGYPDLVGVFTGISINQTGRAIEIVTMTMAVYLAISLLIGALINLFNHMTRIVER